MSGSRVTRLSVLAGLLVLGIDLAINRHLTLVFDLGFVLICVGAALAVRPRDFFQVGVLPPLLLLGLITLVAIVQRDWVAEPGDGLVQAVVSGLAHRASALLAAYVLTLAILALRQRVLAAHAKRGGISCTDARHDGSPVGEVHHRGGLGPALPGVDHRVQPVIQLLLDGQPSVIGSSSSGISNVLDRQPAPRARPAGLRRPGGRGSERRRCASSGASAASAPRRSPGRMNV